MIKRKIQVQGKTIAVCKVERRGETISVMEGVSTSLSPSRKLDSQNINFEDYKLRRFLMQMIVLKNQFQIEMLKVNIKLKEFRKFLERYQ